MDPIEARLLAAIREEPDDDGPLLVYVDWLLERGDPRAELAQVQAALARDPGPWARHVSRRRAEELVAQAPQPRRGTPIYRRGELAGLRIDPRELDDTDALPHLLHVGFASSVPEVDQRAALERLAARADVRDVRELDLSWLGPGWRVLQASSFRPRRLVLPLRGDPDPERGWLTAEDAVALAHSPLFAEVEAVELCGAAGDAALTALLATPLGARLRSLVVGGIMPYGRAAAVLGRDDYQPGPVTDAGVAAIAQHGHAVRRLDLRWNRITAAGIEVLAGSTLALAELRLSHDTLGANGIAALERSRLASIARVSIGRTPWNQTPDAAAYRALVASPTWCERTLDLWSDDNANYDGVLEAVADISTPPAITELRVRGACTAGAIARFCASPAATAIRHVALRARLGAPGARALADATALPLETLVLENCELGPSGAAALFAAPHVERVKHLHLEDCRIGDKGVRALAKSSLRPTELVLRDFTDFKTLLVLLASPVLDRVTDLLIYLKARLVDSRALVKTLVDPARLPAIQKLALPDLSDLAPELLSQIAARYGSALIIPRRPS